MMRKKLFLSLRCHHTRIILHFIHLILTGDQTKKYLRVVSTVVTMISHVFYTYYLFYFIPLKNGTILIKQCPASSYESIEQKLCGYLRLFFQRKKYTRGFYTNVTKIKTSTKKIRTMYVQKTKVMIENVLNLIFLRFFLVVKGFELDRS